MTKFNFKDFLADNPIILDHPKVSAFISHCGMNSLMEGAFAGVPMVCIPLFVEQARNSKMVEKRGFGYFVSKQRLNVEVLTKAVHAVLYEPKYFFILSFIF